jgi:hypothetical protein
MHATWLLFQEIMEQHKEITEKLQRGKNQAAKRNREIALLQRKIDEVPSRAELSQYQKRFVELYDQGAPSFLFVSLSCWLGGVFVALICLLCVFSLLLLFVWITHVSVANKHRETKQYYALYNTLTDTKLYMTREVHVHHGSCPWVCPPSHVSLPYHPYLPGDHPQLNPRQFYSRHVFSRFI